MQGITTVKIIKATEAFDIVPYTLFFCPMTIKLIETTGEEIDITNKTMRWVMNRYSIFDTIRQADTFMLLLLDPDWCL